MGRCCAGFRNRNFEAGEWGFDQDGWEIAIDFNDADVRDANTPEIYPNPLLCKRPYPPELLPDVDVSRKYNLQITMREFAQRALLNVAVDVIAVRTVAGVEIFFEADESGRGGYLL